MCIRDRRYGQPSIPATLSRLKTEGCTRFLLLPLYPQYSSSTTASAFDAAFAWAASVRNQPELRTLRSYAGHPGYIEALASSVREHWMTNGRPPASYRLIMSFHGVPRYTLDKGDPYHLSLIHIYRYLTIKVHPCIRGVDDADFNFTAVAHQNRPIGQRVRAKRPQGNPGNKGMQNPAIGRPRISCRPGRRRRDQAIRAQVVNCLLYTSRCV